MKFRATWIVLAIVIALGAYVYWNEKRTDRQNVEREAAARLLALDPAQVTAIRITHSGTVHELQKKGDAWFLTRPLPAPADPRTVSAFLDTLATARREDEVGRGNLPRYGLDAPAAVVEIVTGDGTQRLHFGRINPQQTLVYVMVNDEKDVLLTTSSLLTASLANAFGWRDKRVVELSPREIDRVVIRTVADGTLAIHDDPGHGWRVEGPVPWRVDPARGTTVLLGFAQLNAVGIGAEHKADLGAYGLTNKRVGVSLEKGGNVLADVVIGFADGAGAYFAMVDDKPEVFRIDGRLFETAVSLVRDPRDRKVMWEFDPAKVDRIEVDSPDDRFELRRRSAQDWKVAASTRYDSTLALGSGMVDALLTDLATLEVAEFPAQQPPASAYDPPRIEVRLFTGTTPVSSLSIGRKDPRGMNAFARAKDEPAVFLISPSALLKIPFALDRLKADEEPAPEGADRG